MFHYRSKYDLKVAILIFRCTINIYVTILLTYCLARFLLQFFYKVSLLTPFSVHFWKSASKWLKCKNSCFSSYYEMFCNCLFKNRFAISTIKYKYSHSFTKLTSLFLVILFTGLNFQSLRTSTFLLLCILKHCFLF